jgi:hypothetical protein
MESSIMKYSCTYKASEGLLYKYPHLKHFWKKYYDQREKSQESWLTPVILATVEAEVQKIVALGQPGKIVCETTSPK